MIPTEFKLANARIVATKHSRLQIELIWFINGSIVKGFLNLPNTLYSDLLNFSIIYIAKYLVYTKPSQPYRKWRNIHNFEQTPFVIICCHITSSPFIQSQASCKFSSLTSASFSCHATAWALNLTKLNLFLCLSCSCKRQHLNFTYYYKK